MSITISALLRRCYALMLSAALILISVFTVNISTAHAATTWTVNMLSDDAAGGICGKTSCALRDAIGVATNGDVITFKLPPPYKITLTIAGLSIDKSITIDGSNVGNRVIVDGNLRYGVFTISSGATVELQNLIIENGSNRDGAGVLNEGTVTISNCILSDNSAGNGGGVSNSGTLTIINSTLSGNFSANGDSSGGGLENLDNGTLIIDKSTISGNAAGYGGGLSNDGTVTISRSAISGNSAGNSGGVYNNISGTVTISNSTISGNSAIGSDISGGGGSGGGIVNDGKMAISNSAISRNLVIGDQSGGGVFNDALMTIIDSTISGNSANTGGGVSNGGEMTISNSTLSGNSAVYGGGVLNGGYDTLTITNSTIFGNSAVSGGGLYNNLSGTVMITNSTISGNFAASGGGVYSYDGTLNLMSTLVAKNTGTNPDIKGSLNSLGYNLIGDSTEASGLVSSDQIGIKDKPIDPMLSPLADNGGSTQTMAITSNSPAYQKGFCGGNSVISPAAPAVTTDQRGLPRKGTSTGCDVGAYEVLFPGSFATPAVTSTPSR